MEEKRVKQKTRGKGRKRDCRSWGRCGEEGSKAERGSEVTIKREHDDGA